MKSFVLVALLVSVFVCSVHGSLVCESFDAFTSGVVFSNATSYTPGTIISQGPTSIRTEFFYSKDPTLKLYDSSSVVPSFAAFGTSGNALQLTKQSVVIDFGTQLIRYVRFDFRDYGDVQDLRVNSFTLNKGSMVSMGGYVGDNIAFKPEKVRRRLINSGELFAVTGSPLIRRVWLGGDDLVIDNICWDTEAHSIPAFPVRESAANAASSITFVASTMALVVVAAVALFF